MFVPYNQKAGHLPAEISGKSINRFIHAVLRIQAANPVIYFHHTITFAEPVLDLKVAKTIFNRFMKGVMKRYGQCGLAALHVQEKRTNSVIHYHVCFLLFTPDEFPYFKSRLYRDFRTDLFKRWNKLNAGNSVHAANTMESREFDFATINYFCRALRIIDGPTKRSETNWWGQWNKKLINNRSANPSKADVNHCFNELFRRATPDEQTPMADKMHGHGIKGRHRPERLIDNSAFAGFHLRRLQPEHDRELTEICF